MPNLVPFLFSFKGRINRTHFWGFWAVWTVIFILLNVLTPKMEVANGQSLSIGAAVFELLSLWSLFAVQAKRWHDRNKSGWWCLIGLVPCIGGLWVLIECGFLPSVNEGNRFEA
jgi:uncharacterized membrane protein YhaH (DUF805 family)